MQQRRRGHTADSLSEGADFEPLCKRVAGVAHGLFGVIMRARTQDSHRYVVVSALPLRFCSHTTGFARQEVPLFVASERYTNPRNSIGAVCTGTARPRTPVSTCAASAYYYTACKLVNRRATLVKRLHFIYRYDVYEN